jgi:hypothetical protein
MHYVAIIIGDKDSDRDDVKTATIYAHDDAEAYENAKDWASSLDLPRDQEVSLMVKSPDNTLKTFRRNHF